MSEKINVFEELTQSLTDAEKFYEGKITLKNYKLDIPKPQSYDPRDIIDLRNKLNLSQSVFALVCNVSKKTVQSWEQGLRSPAAPIFRLFEIFENHSEIVNGLISGRMRSKRKNLTTD